MEVNEEPKKSQAEKLKLIQEGLDVQHYTKLYKLDEYAWDLDEFQNCEKQVDGDFTYLQNANVKDVYDAI